MDADKTRAWISAERFAPFLERADGDAALAFDLYLWHARMSGASLTTLQILEPLTSLHLWRNRIAHHDSLLGQDLERRLTEMINVANAIDPACGQWLAAHTDMAALLDQRPHA